MKLYDLCVDLDGIICRTHGMDYEHAQPIRATVEHLRTVHRTGKSIAIDTARGSGGGWWQRRRVRRLTKRQLRRWGVPHDLLRVGVKIPAREYVDDRTAMEI